GVPTCIARDNTQANPWLLSEREEVGDLLAHDFVVTDAALERLLVYQYPEIRRVFSLQDLLTLHPRLELCFDLVHTSCGVEHRLRVRRCLREERNLLAVEDFDDLCGHLVLDVLTEPIRIMAGAGEHVEPLEMSAGVPC